MLTYFPLGCHALGMFVPLWLQLPSPLFNRLLQYPDTKLPLAFALYIGHSSVYIEGECSPSPFAGVQTLISIKHSNMPFSLHYKSSFMGFFFHWDHFSFKRGLYLVPFTGLQACMGINHLNTPLIFHSCSHVHILLFEYSTFPQILVWSLHMIQVLLTLFFSCTITILTVNSSIHSNSDWHVNLVVALLFINSIIRSTTLLLRSSTRTK